MLNDKEGKKAQMKNIYIADGSNGDVIRWKDITIIIITASAAIAFCKRLVVRFTRIVLKTCCVVRWLRSHYWRTSGLSGRWTNCASLCFCIFHHLICPWQRLIQSTLANDRPTIVLSVCPLTAQMKINEWMEDQWKMWNCPAIDQQDSDFWSA